MLARSGRSSSWSPQLNQLQAARPGRPPSWLIGLLVIFASIPALTGCAKQPKNFYHTEMRCPERGLILIRYVEASEVKRALTEFHRREKAAKSSRNYTLIQLADSRSLRLEKLPIDEAIACELRQIAAERPSEKFLKNNMTPSYSINAW